MATQTLAQQLDKLVDRDVRSVIPRLPDYLVGQFRDYHQLQEELTIVEKTVHAKSGRTFLYIGRKMSNSQVDTHRQRIALLRAQLEGMINIVRAIRLGYEPYSVPSKWYAGYAELQRRWDGSEVTQWNHGRTDKWPFENDQNLRWEFSAPMPAPVIEKWEKAKKTGLFDCFIVAAPDASLFREVRSLFCEPALIGYVASGQGHVHFGQPVKNESRSNIVAPGLNVLGGTGFLIVMWDLEKDRKAAGLKF